MNILQVMGCTSDQYGSMERYLVKKAETLGLNGNDFHIVFENTPKSRQFINDFNHKNRRIYQIEQKNFFDLQYYKMISKIIKAKNIDIVHTYFNPTNHYVNIFLTLRGFKKLVRTAANLPLTLALKGKENKNLTCFYLSLRHRFLSIF